MKTFLFTSFSLSFSELSLLELAWLTNHRSLTRWHCQLGHLSHKIVPIEWGVTLYYTIPYHTIH